MHAETKKRRFSFMRSNVKEYVEGALKIYSSRYF